MSQQQLGPYNLGKRIGKGGMGSVYEALHVESGDRVAVKSLSPQLAEADGFRERFEAEIESLKILQHEGIVRLLGFGEDEGVLFYSMELVDGPSLEEEIAAHRRFTWQETLDLGVQICRALKQAHDHGVVHRDIKPANLLLTPEGRIKIADFGIARLFGATQLTTAGGVLGTADYMSPEQADGRPVTDKCDQYSLGCVMYALLAGRPPFRAKTMPEMLQLQRFAEAESVRRYASDTPEQLDKLIQQLLSKDPDDRFPNVLVLARHMEAMQKALARRQQQDAAEPSATPAGADSDERRAGTSAAQPEETLWIDGTAPPCESIDLVLEDELYAAPTMAADDQPGTAATPSDIDASAGVPASRRFTTVDEDARRTRAPLESERWTHWFQLAGLLLALLAIVAIGWALMQPPSADALYDRIQASAADDDLRSLERDLDAFEARFADDPRNEELHRYREELELKRLERQTRAKSLFAGAGAAHPAESIYSDAMELAARRPAQAAAILRDLLALYGSPLGDDPSESDAVAPWLALAERQLSKLDEAAQAQQSAALPLLLGRLQVVRRLEPTRPGEARQIYQAAIDLYVDAPWAAEAVLEARQRLAALPSPAANGTSEESR